MEKTALKPKKTPPKHPVKKVRVEMVDVVIAQANPLIFGRYSLSPRQLKFMRLVFAQFRDGERNCFSFRMDEVAEAMGFEDSGRRYDDIKQLVQDLREKTVWVRESDGSEVGIGWITTPRLNAKNGTVSVQIEEEMYPWLEDLYSKGNFTQIDLERILGFKSEYSIRFYEMLQAEKFKAKAGIWELELSVQQIRKMFNWKAKQYKLPGHITSAVVKPAVAEICGWSDIHVVYEQVKEGRETVGYLFTCSARTAKEKPAQKVEEQEKEDDTAPVGGEFYDLIEALSPEKKAQMDAFVEASLASDPHLPHMKSMAITVLQGEFLKTLHTKKPTSKRAKSPPKGDKK